MGSRGITYADVASAAQAVADAGGNPTVDNVRAAMGDRGSRSTIAPLLRQWKEQFQEDQPEAGRRLPGELLRAVEGLYERVTAAADERVAQASQKFHEQAAELQRQLREAQDQAELLARERDALGSELLRERGLAAEHRETVRKQLEKINELRVAHAGAEGEAALRSQQLEAEKQKLIEAHEQRRYFEATMIEQRRVEKQEVAQLLASRDQQLVDLKQQVQQLRQEATQAATALADERVTSTANAQRAMRLQEAVNAAGQLQDRLDAAHNEAREAWRQERDRLMDQLTAAMAAADAAERSLAAATRQLETLQQAVGEAEAERHRLLGRLEQLEKWAADTTSAGDKG
jgi:DNA-binding protein YbaB